MANLIGILPQKHAGKACKKCVFAAKNSAWLKNNGPFDSKGKHFDQTGTLL
jgi:hypothetical protein